MSQRYTYKLLVAAAGWLITYGAAVAQTKEETADFLVRYVQYNFVCLSDSKQLVRQRFHLSFSSDFCTLTENVDRLKLANNRHVPSSKFTVPLGLINVSTVSTEAVENECGRPWFRVKMKCGRGNCFSESEGSYSENFWEFAESKETAERVANAVKHLALSCGASNTAEPF